MSVSKPPTVAVRNARRAPTAAYRGTVRARRRIAAPASVEETNTNISHNSPTLPATPSDCPNSPGSGVDDRYRAVRWASGLIRWPSTGSTSSASLRLYRSVSPGSRAAIRVGSWCRRYTNTGVSWITRITASSADTAIPVKAVARRDDAPGRRTSVARATSTIVKGA